MSDNIHIEQLELNARVGVPEGERARPQRITVSLTLWPQSSFRDLGDDLGRTVNYSAIAREVKALVDTRSDKLIETLAENIALHLLRQFPLQKVFIELRKFVLTDAKYVAVVLTRERDACL